MSSLRAPRDAASNPLLIDYKSPDGARVKAVRSTLISSSLATLKQEGLFDAYLARLPAEHRDRILLTIAPEWLPIEVGEAHYRTCDSLGLSDKQLERLGELVSERIMGTFLGTLVRTSGRNVGATPWIPLGKYDMLWSRLMQGGACTVERVGPKDATIRAHGCSLFETHYFQVAYNGVVRGATGMFAKAVTGRTTRTFEGGPGSVITNLSWV